MQHWPPVAVAVGVGVGVGVALGVAVGVGKVQRVESLQGTQARGVPLPRRHLPVDADVGAAGVACVMPVAPATG